LHRLLSIEACGGLKVRPLEFEPVPVFSLCRFAPAGAVMRDAAQSRRRACTSCLHNPPLPSPPHPTALIRPPMIHALNHFTIAAANREQTLDFYCGVLGLVEGPRPELGFPGAWLYAPGGTQALLHVNWDRPMPAQRTGVIDHMAFTASDLKTCKARFDERKIDYTLRRQPGAGTWQLFCHDPNGARVELDFDAAELP
jgi:catechol 2,3-dioxygenase-like lactoylglutathione lyase family enzyme